MNPRRIRTAAVVTVAGALGATGVAVSSAQTSATPRLVPASAAQAGGLPPKLSPSQRRLAERNENVRTALRWVQAFQSGNVDAFDDILAPSYRDFPLPGVPAGAAGFEKFVTDFSKVFKLRTSIKDIVAGQNKVVVRSVVTGKMVGPFLGLPASGKDVRWDATDIHTLSGGRIVVTHHLEDSLARAIGAGGKVVPAQG